MDNKRLKELAGIDEYKCLLLEEIKIKAAKKFITQMNKNTSFLETLTRAIVKDINEIEGELSPDTMKKIDKELDKAFKAHSKLLDAMNVISSMIDKGK